jgi:hypothetical protein
MMNNIPSAWNYSCLFGRGSSAQKSMAQIAMERHFFQKNQKNCNPTLIKPSWYKPWKPHDMIKVNVAAAHCKEISCVPSKVE